MSVGVDGEESGASDRGNERRRAIDSDVRVAVPPSNLENRTCTSGEKQPNGTGAAVQSVSGL